jgi:peptidoglycan/LPS O-acetylase OafA/YrhL
MILLRLLSILAGGLVMVSPALFMSGGSAGPDFFDGRTVFGAMAGLAVVASAFFFVGFAGQKMRKSARLRAVAALLLAVAFVAGLAVLWDGGDASELVAGALLCSVSAVLFVAFVLPAQHSRKHRPMRRRESLAN